MILTVFGFILLLAPFLALKKFKDPKIGFFNITLFTLFIQLLIALITQTLHIFYYQTVLILNSIVFLTCLFLFRPSGKDLNLAKKLDWILIFVVTVAFAALYLAHYHYTGSYSTATNQVVETKTAISYPYPYFSDEWYAIAFMKDSITTHSLPIRNPIWKGPFTNLELAFHSLLAEVTLLLRLNPLTGYVILSIGFNVLIVVLLYLFLIVNKINRQLSAIAALSALYITNALFLPGLWTLLPLSLGIVFLFLSMSFHYLKSNYMFMLASFLTLIFYPPLIIFIFILMISQFNTRSLSKKRLTLLFQYAAVIIIPAIFISALFLFDRFPPHQIFQLIMHKLFYASYVGDNFISSFPIYYVIPIPILLFAVLGLPTIYKERKAVLFMIIISSVFWKWYAFTSYRFIIEFERLIMVASLLIIITAGFGLKNVFDALVKFKKLKGNSYVQYLQYIILFLFVPLLFVYTKSDSWKHFSIHQKGSRLVVNSLPLPSQFLNRNDLALFAGIKNKRFLSSPWKGTVISIATGNIPSTIKHGTVSGPKQDYLEQFHELSCKEKLIFTKLFNLSYVYSPLLFDCPGFQIKGVSTEGFYLYKIP